VRAWPLYLGLVGLVAGCNQVLGLEPTGLVDDRVRTLVFDNSASHVDLVDFPVLVALDPTRIPYPEIAQPTTQLRFFDPDTGQDLAFEIERWDPTGRSELWVKVPQIDARSTTDHILLFFGAAAGGLEQPSGVWSSFDFVYHGMPTRLASSIGAHPGTAEGVATAEGAIASAPRFTGGTWSEIEFADTGALLNGWDRFSFEFWLYPDYAPSFDLGGTEPRYFENGGAVSGGRLLASVVGIDTLLNPQMDVEFATSTSYMHPSIQRQAWVYTVYSFDGEVLAIYRNGGLADLEVLPAPTRLIAAPGQLTLGSRTHAMVGVIDEVRVSRRDRDADWVNAQFLAMTGKFVTFSEAAGR